MQHITIQLKVYLWKRKEKNTNICEAHFNKRHCHDCALNFVSSIRLTSKAIIKKEQWKNSAFKIVCFIYSKNTNPI